MFQSTNNLELTFSPILLQIILNMSTLFAEAAQVEFIAPVFENKDKVIFDDSHTKEVLQLEWKHKVADEVKVWVGRIKELGTYFLE
jgi:hypothetical protein